MITHDIIRAATLQHGSPLLITDCNSIRQQYHDLKEALPNVTLHYALKPFPHKTVISVLDKEGASFDVATSGEIKLVKALNIPAEKCIHTHPIKRERDIRDALNYGITQFVVDNEEEIYKFKKFKKRVKLLLRIAFRNPSANIDLSKKFGCSISEVMPLLTLARKLGIRINGFSFHVGSQSNNSDMYVHAIKTCKNIIAETILQGLPSIDILDIGGGFPIDYQNAAINIMEFCKPITEELKTIPQHIKILAEPGRFIVGPSTVSVSTIIGKSKKSDVICYYIDDGIYDSYSLQFFDSAIPPIEYVQLDSDKPITQLIDSVIWGITCDSTDLIREIKLPELNINDFIVAKQMGAYTSLATGTNFNMVNKAKYIFINV